MKEQLYRLYVREYSYPFHIMSVRIGCTERGVTISQGTIVVMLLKASFASKGALRDIWLEPE